MRCTCAAASSYTATGCRTRWISSSENVKTSCGATARPGGRSPNERSFLTRTCCWPRTSRCSFKVPAHPSLSFGGFALNPPGSGRSLSQCWRVAAVAAAILPLLLAACAPGQGVGRPDSAAAVPANADENRTLVFATRHEPVYISKRGLQSTAPGSTAPALFDAGLTQTAGQGTPSELQLAEAFPQLGTDSWIVHPDGRMETRWRLRPNLTWH